jgi:hypothetical protein
MMVLADQTALWLALGLTTGVLLAITVFALVTVFFAVFDGDADTIVEARQMVPRGLPLFHSERAAATTAGARPLSGEER